MRSVAAATIGLLLALSAAACGDDDAQEPSASPTRSSAGAESTASDEPDAAAAESDPPADLAATDVSCPTSLEPNPFEDDLYEDIEYPVNALAGGHAFLYLGQNGDNDDGQYFRLYDAAAHTGTEDLSLGIDGGYEAYGLDGDDTGFAVLSADSENDQLVLSFVDFDGTVAWTAPIAGTGEDREAVALVGGKVYVSGPHDIQVFDAASGASLAAPAYLGPDDALLLGADPSDRFLYLLSQQALRDRPESYDVRVVDAESGAAVADLTGLHSPGFAADGRLLDYSGDDGVHLIGLDGSVTDLSAFDSEGEAAINVCGDFVYSVSADEGDSPVLEIGNLSDGTLVASQELAYEMFGGEYLSGDSINVDDGVVVVVGRNDDEYVSVLSFTA